MHGLDDVSPAEQVSQLITHFYNGVLKDLPISFMDYKMPNRHQEKALSN